MKRWAPLVFLFSLFLSPRLAASAESDPFFSKIWEKALPKLEKSLEVFDRQKDLPDSSFFGEDKQSNTEKYDALLNEVFSILIGSELQNSRQEYNFLEMKIEQAGDEITVLLKEKIGAPETTWNPLKKTRAKIDEKITDLREDIDGLMARKTELKRSMRESLAKMGVNVEEQQLDVLLSSISGDDVLHLLLAADSIKKINLQIMDLLQGGQGSVQSARKYTGVHMVLVDLYLQANLNVLEKIGGEYIPRLEDVMKTARRLGDEARQMLSKADRDEKNRQVLEANVRANERTVQTAELYRKYLRGQENALRGASEKLKKDYYVARNTYDTVKTGSDLISLIQVSMNTLEGVFGFAVPDLALVYDQELMKEFERITERIRRGK
jgi:peptidoglycan hydrolase CwlO-like protein